MINTGAAASEDERDIAAELVASGPGPEEWAEFEAWRLGRWRDRTFKRFVDEGWGLLSVVEPVRPDVELVRFGVGRDGRRLEPGEEMLAQAVAMQFIGATWLVAGIGRTVAVPGWPPHAERLPTDLR